jgi:hypothetical protein
MMTTAKGRASQLACAMVALLFLALAAMTLSSKGVLVGDKFHDLWVLVDALSRGSARQIPHVDFHSPAGQFFLLPYYIVAQFGPLSGTSTLHASLVAGTFVLLLAMVALAGRLWSPLFVAAVLLCATTAISPRSIGDEIGLYDHLAPYNRWGWALIVIASLVALVPREGPHTRVGHLSDGLVVGLIIGALYYLKLTYFVGAIGLVGLGIVLRDYPIRTAVLAGLTFGALVLGVEVALGNNAAYLRDVVMAFKSNVDASNAGRLTKVDNHFLEALIYGVFICVMLWMLQPVRSLTLWLRIWWRELLVASAMLLVCAAIAVQNLPRFEGPLFVAAVIALAERGRRRGRRDPPAGRWRLRAVWLMVVPIVLQYPIMDGASVIAHSLQTRGTAACRLTALAHTPLADVMLPASGYAPMDAGAELLEGCEFARTGSTYWSPEFLHEPQRTYQAVALLRGVGTSSDRLLVAEFSNPYSFLTGTVPVKGALLWWDHGRSYSKVAHPAPAPMLRDATMVLVGTPLHRYEHGEQWLAVYGEALRRDFRIAAESSYWQLWLRTGRKGPEGERARTSSATR